MRGPEIYGYLLTIAIYFIIIKEYRRNRNMKIEMQRRKDDAQTREL